MHQAIMWAPDRARCFAISAAEQCIGESGLPPTAATFGNGAWAGRAGFLTRRANHQKPVQPPLQKYSGFPNRQITSISPAIPSHSEGSFAIVTDAGRDAVDALALLTNSAGCGRRSRVVLMPRRWQASQGRRWQESPVTGESAKQAVN